MSGCLCFVLAGLCLLAGNHPACGAATGFQAIDGAQHYQVKSSRISSTVQELGNLLEKESQTARHTLPGCSESPVSVTMHGTTIMSPGYPSNYPNNIICRWTITAARGQYINLMVNTFAVESAVNCIFDSLTVYDGDLELAKLCGGLGDVQHTLESTGTTLHLEFSSDGSVTDMGFDLTVYFYPQTATTTASPTDPCHGGMLTEVHDGSTITSPNYPNNYPDNLDCFWLIQALPGQYVHVVPVVFDLESADDCSFDSLRAYSGDTEYSPWIGSYCGALGVSSTVPAYFTSSGNVMLLHFISDGSITYQGFLLTVSFRSSPVVPPVLPDECSGGVGLISNNGVHLVSPGYPSDYPNDVDCQWRIEAPAGWYIYLAPIAFQVEVAHGCLYDALLVYDGSSSASHQIGSYCGVLGGSGVLPYSIVSSANNMFIEFRTDESVTYSGFNFRVDFIQTPVITTTEIPISTDPCQGIALVTEDNAVITSPGYPGYYPNDARCQWRIVAPYDKYIYLLPDAFDVEHEPNCYYDSLEAFAGTSASGPLLGVYCGQMGIDGQAPNVVSPGNELFLRFMTDGDVTATGFRIVVRFYTSAATTTPSGGVCNGDGLVTDLGAHVTSPGYPGYYPNNVECHYQVRAPSGKYIHLVPEVFSVEDSVGCVFDAVRIFDGSSDSYPLIGRYCGTLGYLGTLPMNVVSTGQALFIVFTSDDSMTDIGFSFRVDFLDMPVIPPSNDACSGGVSVITADGSLIQSPGYPRDYTNNAQCQWRAVAPVGKFVELNVETFSVENAYSCLYDALRLYSGSTAAAPLMGIYCGVLGGSNSIPTKWTSPGNEVYLQFTSDGSVTDIGFNIRVQFVTGIVTTTKPPQGACEGGVGYINQHGSYISSPGYPSQYPNNALCHWSIQAPTSKYIYLVPEAFSVESSHLCVYDALTVYAGSGEHAGVLGTYCGILGSPSAFSYLSSPDNMLYLQFSADGSVTNTGFRIRVEFYDDSVVTPTLPPPIAVPCSGGVNSVTGHNTMITSPGYPGYYPNSVMCEWLIQAPTGQLISLVTEAFAVEHSSDCTYDALYVYDGGSPVSHVIGKYCGTMGSTILPDVQSTGNLLFLKFITDGSVANIGFNIRVQFIDKGIPAPGACSAQDVVITEASVIVSPGYPSSYPNSVRCNWSIHAPYNHYVYLIPEVFSLESSVGCIYDSLVVYDGSATSSNMVGRYCGTLGGISSPPVIVSYTNVLYVTFSTDSSITDIGFSIRIQFYTAPDVTTTPKPSSDPCDGVATIMTHNAALASPGYPGSYANSMLCRWLIQAPIGMYIYLVPSVFDVESGPGCIYDALSVYDGGSTSSRLIGRYCGMMGGPAALSVVVSSHNTMFVTFTTDSTVTDIGFSIQVQFLHVPDLTTTVSPYPDPCSAGYQLVNLPGTRIYSPGYLSGAAYPHHSFCRWMVEAPFKMFIRLVPEVFSIEGVQGCIYDSLSVYDGHSAAVLRLGSFCGDLGGPYSPPPEIWSSTNYLFVQFSTDGSISGLGFSFRVEFN